jgi:hypothetical protein
MHNFLRFKLLLPHNTVRLEAVISLVLAVTILGGQALAVTRFYNRSLFVVDTTPGATTSYTINFEFHTLTTVGSIDILFCFDPIPDHPCDAPTGMDASHAVLASQTGETGFSISRESTNEIVLSRTPSLVGPEPSTYTFNNIVNSTTTTESFSARLSDYASTNANGTLIDLGSVISEIQTPITLETQVPPILDFCLAQQVTADCAMADGGNYSDMGDLSSGLTLSASSQMAAGTNATNGYVITANGPTMTAGLNTIAALKNPAPSNPGTNQFGINLVENTTPDIGSDPDGAATNTILGPNYEIPNEFVYNSGDVVAESIGVSLIRRFTVSYIVNSAANLPAGVYTTTLTFICSGRF